MIRSATFLTVMCTTMKTCVCLLRNYVHPCPPPLPAYIALLSGFIGGFAGLQFEPESRQGELAMYVGSTGITSLYNLGHKRGIFPSIPFGSTIVFMVAAASVMHAYERDPGSLSSLVNGIMVHFCGKPENVKFVVENDKSQSDGKDKEGVSTCTHQEGVDE
ncbi:uncharacterized protein LOC144452672 [Glandiceps talaboti]